MKQEIKLKAILDQSPRGQNYFKPDKNGFMIVPVFQKFTKEELETVQFKIVYDHDQPENYKFTLRCYFDDYDYSSIPIQPNYIELISTGNRLIIDNFILFI